MTGASAPIHTGTVRLNYTVGPHLTLSWTVNYSLQEPDVVGTPARTSLQTGLTGSYKVTPRITTIFSIFYEHDQNDARKFGPFILVPSFAEETFNLAATAHYAINRNWGLELGYLFTDVESGMAFRGYSKDRFYGGANFQF